MNKFAWSRRWLLSSLTTCQIHIYYLPLPLCNRSIRSRQAHHDIPRMITGSSIDNPYLLSPFKHPQQIGPPQCNSKDVTRQSSHEIAIVGSRNITTGLFRFTTMSSLHLVPCQSTGSRYGITTSERHTTHFTLRTSRTDKFILLLFVLWYSMMLSCKNSYYHINPLY